MERSKPDLRSTWANRLSSKQDRGSGGLSHPTYCGGLCHGAVDGPHRSLHEFRQHHLPSPQQAVLFPPSETWKGVYGVILTEADDQSVLSWRQISD